jgi:hypothetical protein
MNSNHTPGPWLLNHNTNWKTNPFSITVRKYGVHSTTVANIPTRMTVPPQEQQANARLLAAAPDLLAALSDLHLAVTMRPTSSGGLSTRERVALDRARAAIAQATGDQS